MKIGIDIGGTKCAVIAGDHNGIFRKSQFPTSDPARTLMHISQLIREFDVHADSIGICCGGPLDTQGGRILSPPNLIGWDDIPITDYLSNMFQIPAYLCNDADAGALAEHRYGIGKGIDNLIFLTFGTGMGAGMILNGKLYQGRCGMAGEIGHIRMQDYGPVGYGKSGSFEGFCSGGGIAQLGKTFALERLQMGKPLPYCQTLEDLDKLDAKLLAEQAQAGDKTAHEVFRLSAEMLGRGVSILIDILNPEMIILGSIYTRSYPLMEHYMEEVIKKEALFKSALFCTVIRSYLGEQIGDYAALAVAYGI
ncbi:MAG: ROK family protein [Ruminococcaceae bacterium]|nr:ROK family protein [Oscillospiraceae bacterium]